MDYGLWIMDEGFVLRVTTQDCKSDLPMRAIALSGDRECSQVNIHVIPYGRKSAGIWGGVE